MDHAREFVSCDPAFRWRHYVAVATPTVQIRAAYDGVSVLDQQASRIDLRCRQLLDVERHTSLCEYGNFSGWHFYPLLDARDIVQTRRD